ncbi:hypothetical protein D3C86_1333900 [compost metagenome]
MVDRAAKQADGSDGGEADDPPQDFAHDGKQRLVEGEERLRRLARFQRGNAEGDRHHEKLQHVEVQRGAAGAVVDFGRGFEAEDVGRDEALQEVEPGAGGGGCRRCRIGNRRIDARLDDEAEHDTDNHRDQRGDGKPQKRLPDELCRVGEVLEIGDGGDDGREDQRRNESAQKLYENAADGLQRHRKPVRTAGGIGTDVARDEPEQQADDHGDQNLKAEIAIKGFRPGGAGGRRCL